MSLQSLGNMSWHRRPSGVANFKLVGVSSSIRLSGIGLV